METAQTPVEALEKSLEIIRTRGWTQDQLMDYETGAVCALGALTGATYGFKADGSLRFRTSGASKVFKQAESFLKEAVSRRRSDDDIVDYNDTTGRTRAEIVRLFQSALRTAKKAVAQ